MTAPASSKNAPQSTDLVASPPLSKVLKKANEEKSTFNIRGRVVHATGGDPVSYYVVKVYRENILVDSLLTTVTTDDHGRFKATVPSNVTQVHFRMGFIPHETISASHPNGELRIMHDEKKSVSSTNKKVGNIVVNHWEYFPKDPNTPLLPFLKMPSLTLGNFDRRMEVTSLIYKLHFAKAIAIPAGTEGMFKLDGYHCSIESIQRAFPDNTTIKLDSSVKPGESRPSRLPAYTGNLLMNGTNPCYFKKGPQEGTVLVEFNWDNYEWDNVMYQLPNTKIICKLDENGALVPIQVALQFRNLTKDGNPLPGPGKDPEARAKVLKEWEVYNQGDAKFQDALRYARTSYIAEGQIGHHLGTHMLIDMHNQAIKRNLAPDSVLRKILDPHLNGTPTINDLGNGLIFGDDGVLTTATALTTASVNQRFADIIGSQDWDSWRPRQSLSKKDTFAQTANLIFLILKQYATEVVNENWEQLKKEGHQIRKFSKELVNNSCPYKPRDGVEKNQWVDLGEIDNSNKPRVIVDGVTKSIRPIVNSSKPNDADKENIIQYVTYIIYHATFLHSWTHDLAPDVGEILFASLGICGDTVLEENDPKSYPHPKDAVTQLKLANVLPALDYGYVLKNEYGDLNPKLISMLKAHEEDFKNLGFPLEKLRSSINS